MLAIKNLYRPITTTCARTFASGTKFEKFKWEDPLSLEGKLTDEEQMVWEAAQKFAQDKLMPRV